MKQWKGFRLEFSCAHFYHQRRWSTQKNKDTFGKCFTQYGHGHDYVLEAEFIESEVPRAQALETLKALREELDHQHLNFVFPEFRDHIPTTENLLLFCLDRLQKKFGKQTEMRLSLWERPDLGAFVQAP